MKKKKSSSKLAFLIFGFVFIAYVIFISVMPSAPKAPNTSSEIQTYEGQNIDLENLDQYPFGESLEKVLLEIGVDDAVEAVCEIDNSFGLTLRITTKSKRLWVSIDDYFQEERNVEWIKDYDSSNHQYYYIADNLSYYNEPIYSYKTGELLIDKVDGESSSYPIVITTEQLVSEINANIDAAKEKYNGKWVKISGKVTFISQSAGMTGYYLYGKRGSEGLKITCWVDNQYAASLSVGVTVTFVGQMREVTIMNNTEIADCKVIK